MTPDNYNHDHDERTLLIPQPSPTSLPSQKQNRRLSSSSILFLAALWVFCYGCSDGLTQPPLTRVLESIYCRVFYKDDPSVVGPGGHIPEELCKGAWVQGHVATIQGWQQFLDCVPGLFLAIPFGWAADKYGRKRLLLMLSIAFFVRSAWIQIVCWFWPLFPIRLVWLSSLHSIFGGSAPVASAMIFVLISDVTSGADRAKNFMRVGSCIFLTQCLAPPLSAILMKRNPWIPLLLGLTTQFICIFVIALIPETLDYLKHEHEEPAQAESSLPSKQAWTTNVRLTLRSFVALAIADLRVPALLSTFLIHTVIISAMPILLQYMSARYGLTLSASALILSLYSAFVVAVLLFLPYLSRALTTLSALDRDILLARASSLIMATAYIAIALSPSAPICTVSLLLSTAGMGLYMLIRSILTALVDDHDVAKVFSAASVIDTIGLMIGAPSMAALFGQGLELGPKWMGLPFVVCAACVGLVAVLLFSIQADDMRGGEESGDEENASRSPLL